MWGLEYGASARLWGSDVTMPRAGLDNTERMVGRIEDAGLFFGKAPAELGRALASFGAALRRWAAGVGGGADMVTTRTLGVLRGLCAVVLCWTTVLFALPLEASQRVALVIGNSAYEHVPRLNNPGNDARDFSARLEALGFQVTTRLDLDQQGLNRALQQFARDSAGAEIALLFFAGHGIEVDGKNWLVPIDARLQSDTDVEFESVAQELALRSVGGAQQLRLVILDACRDNPFANAMQRAGATRSIGRGLGRIEPTGGTLVAYAARDGTTADDGRGRNSPYTAALLRELEEPGVEVSLLFRRVRDRVLESTGHRQEPFTYGSLPSLALYLNPPVATPSPRPAETVAGVTVAPAPPVGVSPEVLELEFWRSIQGSANAGDFEAYLRRYPEGLFTELAKNRIAALRVEPAPARPDAPPAQARLSVKATPTNARIRIMNIVPAYREGMVLDPGRYDIEVSAPGHRTQRRWYELSAGDRVLEVALERLPERPAVTSPATPAPSAAAAPSGAAAGTVHRDRLRDGSMGPEMVLIRGGSFTMGSPASEVGRIPNEVRRQVSVGDVWIGRYEVTFAEYDRFALVTGRDLPGDQGWGRGQRPVINVSWHDATAYAEWLSGETGQRYRLPTEAEWEYACRGGEQQRFCGSDNVDAVAWYSGNSGRKTQPVGGKQTNRFGLYDMSGNVEEWTCSVFHALYKGAEQRCDASGERRVLRGGSWYYEPGRVRSAFRFSNSPGDRGFNLGFRLARSP